MMPIHKHIDHDFLDRTKPLSVERRAQILSLIERNEIKEQPMQTEVKQIQPDEPLDYGTIIEILYGICIPSEVAKEALRWELGKYSTEDLKADALEILKRRNAERENGSLRMELWAKDIQAKEKAEAALAIATRKICDFQAASMLNLGSDQDPSRIEPVHVEAHITELRADLASERARALQEAADAVKATTPIGSKQFCMTYSVAIGDAEDSILALIQK